MSEKERKLLNSIYYRLDDETELSKEESNLLLKFIKRLNEERSKTYENGLNYFLELQEKKQEIERLNEERKFDIKYNKYLQKELAKANSIIKEVREYIELGMNFDSLGVARTKRKLLEILDKGE